MSPAFISVIENTFPNASITFDKFHVMKIMNDAIDRVRREEQSHNAMLKSTRYVWLKNPENLTIKQNEAFRSLKDLRLDTLKRITSNWLFAISGITKTRFLQKITSNAGIFGKHSRLNPVIDCAKTMKQHWNGINNYIKTKINNGILEGTNSLIQAAKDSARGFRSTKNFIISIYLRTGKLEFNLPT